MSGSQFQAQHEIAACSGWNFAANNSLMPVVSRDHLMNVCFHFQSVGILSAFDFPECISYIFHVDDSDGDATVK